MKKIKLKFFASTSKNARTASNSLQKEVDDWQKQHPDFEIQKSELKSVPVETQHGGYSRDGGMILCIEYYELDISNRKLIVENENY